MLDDLLVTNPDDEAELEQRLRIWGRQRAVLAAAVAPVGATLRARTWDHMAAEIETAIIESRISR